MKKQLSNIFLALMFLVGLSVLLYPIIANAWNSKVQSGVITDYEAVLSNMNRHDYSEYFDEADEFNNMLLQIDSPMSHIKEFTEYQNILRIPGADIMGFIAIEKIKVELPIYHGTSNAVLSVGAGHLEGTSFPIGGKGTHSALSAHRGLPSAKLFSDLDEMEIGDTFTITVLDRLITYQVDQILIVEPHEVDALAIDPNEDYCTLVTCTPYGINTHRLLVRGTRIDNAVERPAIIVKNEAVKISPLIVAPFVFIPVLILCTAVYLGGHKKKREPKKKRPVGHRNSASGGRNQ